MLVAHPREILTDITVEPTDPTKFEIQAVGAIRSLQEAISAPLTAVSCTGLIDHATGVIRELDTKVGTTVHDIDLRSAVQQEFDLSVFFDNDWSPTSESDASASAVRTTRLRTSPSGPESGPGSLRAADLCVGNLGRQCSDTQKSRGVTVVCRSFLCCRFKESSALRMTTERDSPRPTLTTHFSQPTHCADGLMKMEKSDEGSTKIRI